MLHLNATAETTAERLRRTEALVELALRRLGGESTAAQIKDWINSNERSVSVKRTGVILNRKKTTAQDRPGNTPTWQLTVSSCLSGRFSKTTRKIDGAVVWSLPSNACPGEVHEVKRRKTAERRNMDII